MNTIRVYMKRMAAFSFFLLIGVQAFAQDTAGKTFWDDPVNYPLTPLYAMTVLLFVTLMLVVVVAIYMLRILNVFVQQAEKERAEKLGIAYVPSISWWTKMWDQLNAAVPISDEKDIDLGHEYDGIRELDNHLPPWWKGILYGSIVWAVGYMIVYHFTGSLPLSIAEYEDELAVAADELRVYRASQPTAVIDENTLAYASDPAIITNGKKVFTSNNCQSCHRDDGGGNAVGPNLTDTYWIHGGSIKNIYATIKVGVVEKGMPAWGKVMSPTDVRDVAFYVMSLQGTTPINAKAPQGTVYTPEAIQVPADSTKGVTNP